MLALNNLYNSALTVDFTHFSFSDDLLHVLDKTDGLWGAALDVTQPEPLPNNHPLWSHPKTIITPHLSGFVYPSPPNFACPSIRR